MGFNKSNNSKSIAVMVEHPWYPDGKFVFHLAKRLSEDALHAQALFVGLDEKDRSDEHRDALIRVVARMSEKEPEGFEDFPRSAPVAASNDLAFRMINYFDDPEHPELERILVSVWRTYWSAAVPQAYLKSVQSDSPGTGDLPAATPQTAA